MATLQNRPLTQRTYWQELSTILRYDLKPFIFLINNRGYTIERAILRRDAAYNEVANCRYADADSDFRPRGPLVGAYYSNPSSHCLTPFLVRVVCTRQRWQPQDRQSMVIWTSPAGRTARHLNA